MKAPELIFIGLDGAVDAYVAQEVAKGNLPNFARFLKRGCRLTDFRPVHPTITPVCWSALQTGATPEINGIVSDQLYLGGPLSKLVSAYNGSHLKAERFWEAAARVGKTSLIDSLPTTAPRKSDLVWQMEGSSGNPGRMVMPDGSTEYIDVPQQLWLFDKNKKPVDKLKDIKERNSPVQEAADGSFMLEVLMDTEDANRHDFLPFTWDLKATEEGFALSGNGVQATLLPERWTDPLHCEMPTRKGETLELTFRFGCFAFEDGFLVFGSAACYVADRVFPEEFGKLFHHMPPTPVHKEYVFLRNPATNKITMESWELHSQWHFEMFRRAMEVKVPDIVVTYMGHIDTTNHVFWQKYTGAVPGTEEERELAKKSIREVYELADRYIGFFMDEIADENTTIILVSDHGSIGIQEARSVNDALVQAGLLTYRDNKWGDICWEKTRAAVRGCGHIFVNLEERGGIVPASEYESTVDEVITALQDNMRDPDGRSYLAFAVRKREAGFFGLGGDRCGDVVFGDAAGYASQTVHAEQIPTATNEYGSMRALCMLAGPGIPGEMVWNKPVNSIDVAPTLCAKMGFPLPADCNGRVIPEFQGKK